ncbi:L,D-transpeptidase-like protein [Kribbella amoyensis]|uniref:L,D-transpeptidase-like protein n=1 Tax=Kribbella amoyensis TaxID=996641 RepID=A0A561B2S2_9ACTN|nr:L,D-transpeptidase [Kribbella amoyensis]TWD73160.1 L,D-transpeptidase-like protein [Kribbella amoyensis]
MTGRRRLVAGALLIGLVLTGCTDVAAEEPSGSPSPGSPTAAKTPSAPTTAPSATPTATPSGTPTATPTSTPTATPTSKPTTTPTAKVNYALEVEKKLDAWGFPVGDVDGDITLRARQALCAWRETNGLPAHRGKLTTADVRSVLLATKRPAPTKPDGIYVNKTCQVLYQVKNQTFRRIVWVSTGAPGYETPNRTGKVWRKWAGAHESSLYDDAYMYDSIYFLKDRPGIALHGSRANSLIKTYPASHRCVRVMRPQINRIFAESPIGTTVSVYGEYKYDS